MPSQRVGQVWDKNKRQWVTAKSNRAAASPSASSPRNNPTISMRGLTNAFRTTSISGAESANINPRYNNTPVTRSSTSQTTLRNQPSGYQQPATSQTRNPAPVYNTNTNYAAQRTTTNSASTSRTTRRQNPSPNRAARIPSPANNNRVQQSTVTQAAQNNRRTLSPTINRTAVKRKQWVCVVCNPPYDFKTVGDYNRHRIHRSPTWRK